MYEIAFCYAILQQSAPAREYLARALKVSSDDPELLFTAGKIYALLAEPDHAMKFLEQAQRAHYPLNLIRDDPAFRSLANKVQFEKLVGTVQ